MWIFRTEQSYFLVFLVDFDAIQNQGGCGSVSKVVIHTSHFSLRFFYHINTFIFSPFYVQLSESIKLLSFYIVLHFPSFNNGAYNALHDFAVIH